MLAYPTPPLGPQRQPALSRGILEGALLGVFVFVSPAAVEAQVTPVGQSREASPRHPTEPPSLIDPSIEGESTPPKEKVTPQEEEAREELAAPPKNATPPSQEKNSSPRLFKTMLLIEGLAQYGTITFGHMSEADEPEIEPDTKGSAHFGVRGLVGLMPDGSAFTLAGRLHFGGYLRDEEFFPNMGVAMLFGANFSRKDEGRSFSYAMGGIGVDYLPTKEEDLLTLHASVGSVFNSFNIGGSLEVGANHEYAIAMLGLQMGWGHLY